METQNSYQLPRTELVVEKPSRNEKIERILRRLLRFVYATYACFTVLFCLFGLFGLLQQPGAKSSVSMLNSALMAYSSVMAFRSMKQSPAAALRYAVLLLIVGFGTTAIYRAAFVTGSPASVDLSNLLIFGIPAALTFYCSRLALRFQEPNNPLQPVAREDTRSG
jgi:hypothetical protein